MSKNSKKNTLQKNLLATASVIAVLSSGNLSVFADRGKIDGADSAVQDAILRPEGLQIEMDEDNPNVDVSGSLGGEEDGKGKIIATTTALKSELNINAGKSEKKRVGRLEVYVDEGGEITVKGNVYPKVGYFVVGKHGKVIMMGDYSVGINGDTILEGSVSFKGGKGYLGKVIGQGSVALDGYELRVIGVLPHIMFVYNKSSINFSEWKGAIILKDRAELTINYTKLYGGIDNENRRSGNKGKVYFNDVTMYGKGIGELGWGSAIGKDRYLTFINVPEVNLDMVKMQKNSLVAIKSEDSVVVISPQLYDKSSSINATEVKNELRVKGDLGNVDGGLNTLNLKVKSLVLEGKADLETINFNDAPSTVTFKQKDYRFGEMLNASQVILKPELERESEITFYDSKIEGLKFDFTGDLILTLKNSTAKFPSIIHKKGEGRLRLIGNDSKYLSPLGKRADSLGGLDDNNFGSVEITKDVAGQIAEHYLGALVLNDNSKLEITGEGYVYCLKKGKNAEIVFKNEHPITYYVDTLGVQDNEVENQDGVKDLEDKLNITIDGNDVDFTGTGVMPGKDFVFQKPSTLTLPEDELLDDFNIESTVPASKGKPKVEIFKNQHTINQGQKISGIDIICGEGSKININNPQFDAVITPKNEGNNNIVVNVGEPKSTQAIQIRGFGENNKKIKNVNINVNTTNLGDTYVDTTTVGFPGSGKITYRAGGNVATTFELHPDVKVKLDDGVNFISDIVAVGNQSSDSSDPPKVIFKGSSEINKNIGSTDQPFKGEIEFKGDKKKQILRASIYTTKILDFGNNDIVVDRPEVELNATTSINGKINLGSNKLVLKDSSNTIDDDDGSHVFPSEWGSDTSINTTFSPDHILGSIDIKTKIDIAKGHTVYVDLVDNAPDVFDYDEQHNVINIDNTEGKLDLKAVRLGQVQIQAQQMQAYVKWEAEIEKNEISLIRKNIASQGIGQDMLAAGGKKEDADDMTKYLFANLDLHTDEDEERNDPSDKPQMY